MRRLLTFDRDLHPKRYSVHMEEIYCFAGNPLDRVSQRRQDAGWVASLLEDPHHPGAAVARPQTPGSALFRGGAGLAGRRPMAAAD